jgi:CRISPR-associated endoribonuclease Cas6
VRVKLTLNALRRETVLPLNYHHAVASFIYATLASASVDFAAQLHDVGFRTNGRTFKLFTFSRLQTTRARQHLDKLVLEHPEVLLQISSPVGQFIEKLIGGFSGNPIVEIAGNEFQFVRAELIPPPIFQERMKLRALSPITESVRGEREHPTFLSLEDDWSEVMGANLLRKYEALYDCQPDDKSFVWRWDKDYIARAEQRGKRLSVLREIHGISIRGWLAPFTVEGSKALIELGYEAGFGARNSMGFGMAEVS